MPSQSVIPRLEEWMRKYRLPLMPVIWSVTCLIIGILIAVGLYSYSSAEKAMADQFNQQQLLLTRLLDRRLRAKDPGWPGVGRGSGGAPGGSAQA